MKLYMIRWPNGDTSVVGAPTKGEALLFAADEWGDPYYGTELLELKRFALNLIPIAKDGRLEFVADTGPFGGDEQFHLLRAAAYPIIKDAVENEKFDELGEKEAQKVVAEALRLEKLRIFVRQATKVVQ